MIEQLIVGLIVLAATVSVFRRYLAPKAKGGCGSGSESSCSSCNACSEPVTPKSESGRKVIPIRLES
jgi:hypothetical protein